MDATDKGAPTLRTPHLGLAAYLKMRGLVMLPLDGRTFVFEMPADDARGIRQWAVEYHNSECARHDSELVTLRKLLPRRRRR